MASGKQGAAYGLRLSLGGAPATWHVIPGVPGLYHPVHVTPVDGPGEVGIEAARGYDADPGMHLELVEVPGSSLPGLREVVAGALAAAAGGAAEAAKTADGGEPARITDELEAVRAAAEEDD